MKKALILGGVILVTAVIAVKYFIGSVKGSMVKLAFMIDGMQRQAMYFPTKNVNETPQLVGNAMGVKPYIYTEGNYLMLKTVLSFTQFGITFNGTYVTKICTVEELAKGYIDRTFVNLLGHTFGVRVSLVQI